METPGQQGEPTQRSADVLKPNELVRLGALVVSTLAFNWLSNLWAPAAPIVVLLVILSLGVLAWANSDSVDRKFQSKWLQDLKGGGVVELVLAAFIFGVVAASVSLLPIWPSATIHLVSPMGGRSLLHVHNYELGATFFIILMVTISAYRAPNLRRQTAFLAGAAYGLAVTYSYLRFDENSFGYTLLGSLVSMAIVTVLLVALPRMLRVLLAFFGISHTPKVEIRPVVLPVKPPYMPMVRPYIDGAVDAGNAAAGEEKAQG